MVSPTFRPQEQLFSSSAPWHWEPCLYVLKRRGLTGFLTVFRLGNLLLHQEKLTSNCHGDGELQPYSPGVVPHISISGKAEEEHSGTAALKYPRKFRKRLSAISSAYTPCAEHWRPWSLVGRQQLAHDPLAALRNPTCGHRSASEYDTGSVPSPLLIDSPRTSSVCQIHISSC